MQNIFTGEVAERYDADCADVSTPEALAPMLDVLVDLADGDPALEFAIGTGRVALPLAARGVPVSGIELSEDMIARLRAKPGGEDVPVVVGDMASARVPGRFGLVYLVFNTLSNLIEQDEQVACFANAAAHLAPGGCFVVEQGEPELRLLPPGAVAVPFEVDGEHLGFDTYDLVTQRLTSHHYRPGQGRVFASVHRYAWFGEMDLMARQAGLRLRHRWADWDRTPPSNDDTGRISVWERVAA
ncbi:MAG: class I SAM-dependent methyltransferase [Propionicimonas sp.]|uniref:class I SAM-dependent DNA methyltransferase n=1 Tax=Propionicimonas sp. TaxID=1955623 RepID=UPI003D13D799